MTQEKLFGIIQPFRKLCVLLNFFLIGLTTYWGFEFATEALKASETHWIHIAAVITAIYAPLVLLTRSILKMYWEGRNA